MIGIKSSFSDAADNMGAWMAIRLFSAGIVVRFTVKVLNLALRQPRSQNELPCSFCKTAVIMDRLTIDNARKTYRGCRFAGDLRNLYCERGDLRLTHITCRIRGQQVACRKENLTVREYG